MLRRLFDLAPRALALLPPEQAHEVTLRSLELGVFPCRRRACTIPRRACNFAGLRCLTPLASLQVSIRTRASPTQYSALAADLPRSAR